MEPERSGLGHAEPPPPRVGTGRVLGISAPRPESPRPGSEREESSGYPAQAESVRPGSERENPPDTHPTPNPPARIRARGVPRIRTGPAEPGMVRRVRIARVLVWRVRIARPARAGPRLVDACPRRIPSGRRHPGAAGAADRRHRAAGRGSPAHHRGRAGNIRRSPARYRRSRYRRTRYRHIRPGRGPTARVPRRHNRARWRRHRHNQARCTPAPAWSALVKSQPCSSVPRSSAPPRYARPRPGPEGQLAAAA